MILFDLDKLATHLRDDALSERDKLHYVLLLVIVSAFSGSASFMAFVRNPVLLAVYGGILVVYIAGLLVCFNTNRRGDNRAFVERLIVLGAPVSLRMVLIIYTGWYGTSAMLGRSGIVRLSTTNRFILSVAIQLIAYFAAFLWLRGAFEVAAAGPRRTSAVIKSGSHALQRPTV